MNWKKEVKFLRTAEEALNIFNPKELCKHLVRGSDGTVYVDKNHLLADKDEENLFVLILNLFYKWSYNDYRNSTVYFEVEDGNIIGGVYNTETKQKYTRVRVATKGQAEGISRQYSYEDSDLSELCNKIVAV